MTRNETIAHLKAKVESLENKLEKADRDSIQADKNLWLTVHVMLFGFAAFAGLFTDIWAG